MIFNFVALGINVVVSTIIISPVVWFAGRLVVGHEQARFVDAVLIVVLGTVVGTVFGVLFRGVIGAVIQLILWLALTRHYFECGWGTAFVISVVSIFIFIMVAVVLGIVGFTLFAFL